MECKTCTHNSSKNKGNELITCDKMKRFVDTNFSKDCEFYKERKIKLTRKQVKQIAKLHMYSFFYTSDTSFPDNLLPDDAYKINEEIKSICGKELNKMNLYPVATYEECVDVIMKLT